jgi:hypothetical protein
MERHAIDQRPGATQSGDARAPQHTGEPTPEVLPRVESVTLPPFFAVSPGLKQLPARLRVLLSRASPNHEV